MRNMLPEEIAQDPSYERRFRIAQGLLIRLLSSGRDRLSVHNAGDAEFVRGEVQRNGIAYPKPNGEWDTK